MLGRELREQRAGDAAAGGHVVEGGDDVEHRPRLELPGLSLRLLPHVVRRRAGVDDGVVPQPAVVGAPVAQVDQGLHPIGEARLGDADARGNGVGQRAAGSSLNRPRQRAERPGLDRRPHRQFAEVSAVAASAPVAQDVAVPAALDVAQARLDGLLAITDVDVEVGLEVPAVRPVLVGDDPGGVRSEHELDAGQWPDERGAQRLVGVVDGTDLLERAARPEAVVAEVRSLLEVPGVAGEPVVVRRCEEPGALGGIGDGQAPADHEGHLLIPGQRWLHAVPRKKEAPPI